MFGRLMLLVGCSAIAFAQSGASIEGRVVSTGGGPVRRVTVMLRFMNGVVQVSGLNSSASAVAVESDGEGRFSLPNLSAGTVMVTASRTGYADTNQTVELAAGQRVTDLTLRLTRLGSIYGKVVDEYGDPFARVNVGLFRKTYNNGWQWQQQGSVTTGPDGSYALGDLQPGRYYVAGTITLYNSYNGMIETSRYVQTYYPNVTEANGATAIDVEPESEVHGIDIRMQKGRVFRVTGKITGVETFQGGSVSLVPRDSRAPQLMRPSGGVNAKDYTFAVERVPEGSYYAVIQSQVRPTKEIDAAHPPVMMTGRQEVTVTGRDVENLVIPLTAGVEISGRSRVEGTMAASAPQPRILLRPVDPSPTTGSVTTVTNPDGTFTIRNVSPGSYQVTAQNVVGAYLASVRYDGQDVMSSPITVGSGAAGTLDVVFKTDGAKLSGGVRDEKGEPVATARVTLWATDPKSKFVAAATTDRTGAFRIQNIPPGEYRVAAWDPKATAGSVSAFTSVVSAPEFVQMFDTTAATIRVEASSEQTQDLKPIPQAAMEAALARLP